jgi:hypothetical protein
MVSVWVSRGTSSFEEEPVDEVLGVLDVDRLAGTLPPEDLQQGLVSVGRVVTLQRVAYKPRVLEPVEYLLGPSHP